MGIFSSLFGQKSSAPRGTAPRVELPSSESTEPTQPDALEARSEAIADTAPLYAEAKTLLDAGDLAGALQVYAKIGECSADPASDLATISGNLGAAGHIQAVIDFLVTRYDPEVHGIPPGLNLLQAYLHQRNPYAAQQLLDLLRPLVTTYSMRDRIDGFYNAILQLRAGQGGEAVAGPGPGEQQSQNVNLITFSKPVWSYALPDGDKLLPSKNDRVRRLGILPVALLGDGVPAVGFPAPDHPLGGLVRGLPFVLAEACWFAPAYQPIATTGLDPQRNLLLCPRPFQLAQVRQLFPRDKEPIDYAIAGVLRAGAGGGVASLEFNIWDVRKGKLLKTLRHEGADAVQVLWPALLNYIEAAKPVSMPIEYALPADAAAHAKALDHLVHFFLVEKEVLPAEKLGEHAPRLAALAAHVDANPGALVPRLALEAGCGHCRNLGLEFSADVERPR